MAVDWAYGMNKEATNLYDLKAERDSTWDLMRKAMDERDHFLKQRDEYQVAADALAAENKVLREALEYVDSENASEEVLRRAIAALKGSAA
jgi:hypothetical protein